MMKNAVLLLLILMTISHSFADESNNTPGEQLQEIIDLFQNDLAEEAITQLEIHESDLITSVDQANDAEALMLLGRVYFYAEMDAKAIDTFKAALQLDPSLSGAHFFTGLIHRYADNLDGAEKSFRDAIAANNTDEKYFVELGRTLEIKGDPASAAPAYENALLLDEGNFEANFNLATIYANQGDTSNAEEHYLAAIKRKPDDVDSHYNLGQIYQNTKQHRSAIRQFSKVADLNPNEWRAIAKLVQENEAIDDYTARDSAIERIYAAWRSDVNEDLIEQGFYIREQIELENGKLFALEYFELKGERARKFVFKLQDEQTGDIKFDVSLGSYDNTTEFARAKGDIGPDERRYHLDGYSPNGSHYTYAFFDSQPSYEVAKDIALKVLAGEYKAISSTIIEP